MYTELEIKVLVDQALDYNLEGAPLLKAYSTRELQQIFNGIGPSWLPEPIREKLSSWLEIFLPAALIHDVQYAIGGSKESFDAVNDSFGGNCRIIVKTLYSWWSWKRYAGLRMANYMTELCQKYGWSAWGGQA